MRIVRLRTKNPDALAVAKTSAMVLSEWPAKADQTTVTIAEENMMAQLLAERPAAVILMDAVRQQGKGIPALLRCPVFTMDAPLDGATFLWTPVPESPAGPPPSERAQGALFAGKIVGYRQREKMLDAIREAGVTVQFRENTKMVLQAFRASLHSVAAVVNMAADRKTGAWQMKGRVIEAGMAGCVLLEQRNPVTAMHLNEGEDYLAWDSPKELPALIARVRSGAADDIAHSLAEKVRTKFTAAAFWSRVSEGVLCAG